jgi:hypothetical protein
VSWAGTEDVMLRASISQIGTTAGLPLGESLPQIRFLSLQILRASIDKRSHLLLPACSRNNKGILDS